MIAAIVSSVAGSVAGYLLKKYFADKALTQLEALFGQAHTSLLNEYVKVKTELAALKASVQVKL